VDRHRPLHCVFTLCALCKECIDTVHITLCPIWDSDSLTMCWSSRHLVQVAIWSIQNEQRICQNRVLIKWASELAHSMIQANCQHEDQAMDYLPITTENGFLWPYWVWPYQSECLIYQGISLCLAFGLTVVKAVNLCCYKHIDKGHAEAE
jgi:hypothetical protein